MDKEARSAEDTGKPSEELQPETDFAEFYYGIISKLYDLKCRQISVDVKTALIGMRRLKYESNAIKNSFFSYKVPAVRCAYLYAYSVLHTVMVYSEFSNFLRSSKKTLFPAFCRDSLRICCLGGGPGTEVVAICKSINDFILEDSAGNDEFLLEASVTMVDKLPHWKREESAVIKAANDSSNSLHLRRITLHTDFMKADLMKPFEKSLKEKLKEADIVTIVKVGASIQEKNSEDCKPELQNMLNNVIDSMGEDSCLFMLDNAGGSVFYKMLNVLRSKRSPSQLQKSTHKEYSLDLKTVKKLADLMNYKTDAKRRPIPPTGIGKVSSCLWIKNVTQIEEKGKSSREEGEVKVISSGDNRSSLSKNEEIEETSRLRKRNSDVTHHSATQRVNNLKNKGKREKKEKKKLKYEQSQFLKETDTHVLEMKH